MDRFQTDELDRIKAVFARFDRHGSGFAHAHQLGDILRLLNQDPTQAHLQDLEAKYARSLDDSDSSAKVIDFPELISILNQEFSFGSTSQNELVSAFKVFDRNQTGVIEVTELRHALTSFGDPLGWDDIDQLLLGAGLPLQGQIAYHSIVAQLTNAVRSSGVSASPR